MSDFAKMDIFFVVTTLAVILLTFFVALALFYIVRILRNVEHISDIASEEAEKVRDDVRDLRAHVRREGLGLSSLLKILPKMFQRIFSNTSRK